MDIDANNFLKTVYGLKGLKFMNLKTWKKNTLSRIGRGRWNIQRNNKIETNKVLIKEGKGHIKTVDCLKAILKMVKGKEKEFVN